jgi:cyclic beta-1,2-glucan synthetase
MRSELFSTEQLQRHARELAEWHAVDDRPDRYALLHRLGDNAELLAEAHARVREGVSRRQRIAPAAEWLLDNYYLIEEQIRISRRHFPRSYSRRLPRLANGPHQGLPRVYALATELISHTDGRVDVDNLCRFTASYQAVGNLTLGELWAIPIMLRLALIENLRRVAVRICDSHRECHSASEWFTRMLAGSNPTDLVMVVAGLVQENPTLSAAFVAEFARRTKGQNPSLSFATVWIEQRLAEVHQTIDQMVLAEHQGQAADQVSIGNSITSLRTLTAIDWRDFVEGISVVESILRGDPAGVYAAMDFPTRDRYRHAVEALSRRADKAEIEVASAAIALSTEALSAEAMGLESGRGVAEERRTHVGYFLIDRGLAELFRRVGCRPTLGMRIAAGGQGLRLAMYLGSVGAITTAVVAGLLAATLSTGWLAADPWRPLWLALLGLAIAMCASQTAVSCINWLSMRLIGPIALPCLDYRSGVPAASATLVVIPCMLKRMRDIDALCAALELRFLGNPDGELYYALLTDFADAQAEEMPEDAALLRGATAAILALNDAHRERRPGIFHLFHRPRRWNARERMWMGQERKRGKLCDLNRLLRHGEREPFTSIVGEFARLSAVAYIITLDADTQLPREEACRLVGTIAHPLNRAVFDRAARRVVDGYGVIQPRVSISMASTSRSWFARLSASEAGTDPYTKVVSDLYQDLFQEGSFIGKGIYDIDAFEAATGRCFPDNAILSHDLIEGCYARSGFASDVLLVEDQPTGYLGDVARRRRWMRGDWQILWWLLPRVPVAGSLGARKAEVTARRWLANPLPALARWKIFDNLRRSLVPPVLLLLLLAGWAALPGPAWWWTSLVALLLSAPVLLGALASLFDAPPETRIRMHLRGWLDDLLRGLAGCGATVVFLPYEASIAVDAACRSLWRMLIVRRRLLEWQTSNEAEMAAQAGIAGTYAAMWVSPALALAVAGAAFLGQVRAIPAALAVATLWFLAPALAWWLSRPIATPIPKLSADDLGFLGRLARRTWRFFETFVVAGDHWLPPDNFQEYAINKPAHRTSPTNIGLALLSNLAARDFGYLTIGQLLERSELTVATMQALERHRGHFFNWYDTLTLAPLLPRYVSTVDSGNLTGHLMVLSAGMAELAHQALHPGGMLAGLHHTVLCWAEVVAQPLQERGGTAVRARHAVLTSLVRRLVDRSACRPQSLQEVYLQLGRLLADAETAVRLSENAGDEARWWSSALVWELRAHRGELAALAPWTAMPAIPPMPGLSPTAWDAELRSATDGLGPWLRRLDSRLVLSELAGAQGSLVPELDGIISGIATRAPGGTAAIVLWLEELRRGLALAAEAAIALLERSRRLALSCTELAQADLSFLYDRPRKLFAIGFNVTDNRMDRSYYDLLSSEARLGSFAAIAQGQVAQEHWFALGRQLAVSGSATAMLSWSGSMFEYLMPQLVMPTYTSSLIDLTNRAVVRRQIAFGHHRQVPWGISESGYNGTDAQLTYQYRAFGVPGLGLKRGLADDLVIAPYASALALMIEPAAACANLRRLSALGHAGGYGMYEAVDYTPARMPEGAQVQTVQSFMAHHQGMSLLALDFLLNDQPMQRRFMAEPRLKATVLLLQERPPRAAQVVKTHGSESTSAVRPGADIESAMRVFTNPNAQMPDVHLLSNGRYHVMVSAAGGGYSRWSNLAVNRWREDPTAETHGMFCYIRDLASGDVWSNTYQPTLVASPVYEAIFTQSRAEFRRRDHDIDVHTQISVSPEHDIELRRITLINRSREVRRIQLTSFTEVVDATQASDLAHPAFSNLFVQTVIDRDHRAILCSRRPRSSEEKPAWMIHLVTISGTELGVASFETDRMRFIGRGRSVAQPSAMADPGPLSGSAGSVLDPVAAIRCCVLLQPDEEVDVDLVFGMASGREEAEELIGRYHDQRLCERVFGLSWTHSQVVLRQLGASEAEAQLYGRMADAIVFAQAARRAPVALLARNHRSQAALWAYGISGDLPIVLVRIADSERIDLVRELLSAHRYWRAKGLIVDLVIWNEDHSVYRQALHDQIASLSASGTEAGLLDRPGGIFVRRSEQMTEEDRILLQTVARMVISDGDGSLSQFLDRRLRADHFPPRLVPSRPYRPSPMSQVAAPTDLVHVNGLGGFTRDGREYIMIIEEGRTTPLPWVNVLANPSFGSVISESGGAYTWAENSHEYRLTTWHCDPVTDLSGEAFYLRDEESGRFWSPTPLPARGAGRYIVRHGFGYSAFQHEEDGLSCEMQVFVAVNAPVKIISCKVRNRSQRLRRLSLTGYWEWVLGEQRQKSAMHVVTELDQSSGVLTARNPYHAESGTRIAFVDVSDRKRSATGDRSEFLGRNGTFASPAAMGRQRLSGSVGAGLDPCAALQVPFDLADDEVREIVFVIGAADDLGQVRLLAQRYCAVEGARRALEEVWRHWNHTLGALHVETPDPSVNILANGWLVYQTIACRLWARSGFFQSGGAFGFRDQLQDAMALIQVEPGLLREHLLRAASRQFREGDVQHWWHPPGGRGVRSHSSDDYLWLPAAVARYCLGTGDTGVLDQEVHFLEGRPVRPDEDAYYDKPVQGPSATLYEHCVRAITNGLRQGVHGLPLMGRGDWNDGMNLVGAGGRGESVWLAFFLYDVLVQFAKVAQLCGDATFAERCNAEAAAMQSSIEANAWDGAWYRRAYFDDGTPLGSAGNAECQIDSLPQSWAVLSGAAQPQRARMAMAEVDQRLVSRPERLIRLFTPPFDRSPMNPGYIKGYVPGVRENGGQYTHAAIWTTMAFAEMGDCERAWELWALINPIANSSSPRGMSIYKAEPYVVAADVYACEPHVGRGGWSWYTGSAGWMYRLLTESLLGLHLEPGRLRFAPRMPASWTGFSVHYRFRGTHYRIRIARGGGTKATITVDGVEQGDPWLSLTDDHRDHEVRVDIGTQTDAARSPAG